MVKRIVCPNCGKKFVPVREGDTVCYICDTKHTITYVFDPEIELHCKLPREN